MLMKLAQKAYSFMFGAALMDRPGEAALADDPPKASLCACPFPSQQIEAFSRPLSKLSLVFEEQSEKDRYRLF
jgi:hypothetical protein